MYPCFRSSCCSGEAFHPAVSAARSCMRDVKWSLWDANDFCVVDGWGALQFCTFDLHTPGMSTVADAASYRRPHQINQTHNHAKLRHQATKSVRDIHCRIFVLLENVDQSSPKSRRIWYAPTPLTTPNFVTLGQKMCQISTVQNFCSPVK